jgi:hypothetical protein
MAAGVIGAGGPAGQLLLAPSSLWRSRCRAGSRRCARSARSPCSRCRWRARSRRRPAPLPKAAPTCLSGNGDALRDPRFWLDRRQLRDLRLPRRLPHRPHAGRDRALRPAASFTGLWLVIAGAANMAGSIGIGMLMKRFASAPLLALVYGMRVVAIAAFVLAPASGAVLLAFALAMGLTTRPTMPPTAELLARGFGVERLSSVLGATMLVHQVGGFFGAWLGGVAVEHRRQLHAALDRRHRPGRRRRPLQFALMRARPAPRPAPSAAPRARWAYAAAPARLNG